MAEVSSYVQYSTTEIQWSWGHGFLLLLGVFVFIGLCVGYRNNQIADDQKKLAKIVAEKARKIRMQKISSLYPKRKLDE